MSMEEMSNPKQKPRGSEEVDLREIFVVISSFFIRAFESTLGLILYLRSFIKRYWVVNVFSFILSIGYFGYTYYSAPPVYTSSMVVSSQYFKGSLILNAFRNLNRLCKQGNEEGVAELLGLPREEVAALKRVYLEPMISQERRTQVKELIGGLNPNKDIELIMQLQNEISIENQSTYIVVVEITNTDILDNLDSAIVNYLVGNKFIKNRIDISRRNLELKEQRLREESAELDSLKNALFLNYASLTDEERRGSGNVYVGTDQQMVDPLTVYREGMRLYDEQLSLAKSLYLQSEIEIVDTFKKFSSPVNSGLLKTIIYAIAFGVLLSFAIGSILDFNKYLNKVEARRKGA